MSRPKKTPTETSAPKRAERVVSAVLDATLEELGRVGFAALSIEDVARIARVNKTTVYRRWPAKPDLVQAAFERFGASVPSVDTGSLRDDLRAFFHAKLRLGRTPRGRALMRTLQSEVMSPGLLEISRRLRLQEVELYRKIFARARARKELARGLDDELLIGAIEGPFTYRFLVDGKLVSDARANEMLDVVLRGILSASG